ncbi:MAG: hypothetical protein ACOC4Y_00795 [bacterium]
MKLRELSEAKPIIDKIFDKLRETKGDWKRVVELTPAYRKLMEKTADLDFNKNYIFTKWADKETGRIPPEKQPFADKEYMELLNEEIDIKELPKFTQDEVEDVITPVEFAKVWEFIKK